MQQYNRRENEKHLRERLEEVKNVLPDNTRRAAVLATEKGASSWLTVIPLKDMNFILNKREFKDAVHLRYNWHIADTPSFVFAEMLLRWIMPWCVDEEDSSSRGITSCVIS